MSDIERKRKRKPGSKPESGGTKKVRREDLSDESKEVFDEEKVIDDKLWRKEAEERLAKKYEKLLGKTPEKSEAEAKFDELLKELRERELNLKIKELTEKLNPPTDPDHIKEFKEAKRRMEEYTVREQTLNLNKELEKKLNPPKLSKLDEEFKTLTEANQEMDRVLRNEALAQQIKLKKEQIANKSKYLGGQGDGWFSSIFKTNKSKNLTGGGLIALGLLMGLGGWGLLPALLGFGTLVSESDESKAKKRTA